MKTLKLIIGISCISLFVAPNSGLYAQERTPSPSTVLNSDGKPILPQQRSDIPLFTPDGGACENSWSLVASLNWGQVADWDLHLLTPTAHIYYGSLTADGFTLDRDAYPVCHPTPFPPEGITGTGHCGTYRVYSNLYSTCGGSPPATFSATVTVHSPITINGVAYGPGETFIPGNGVDFTVASGGPTIEVTVDEAPADQIYRLGTEPSMPQIKARARVTGVTPDPTDTTTFTWTVNVNYDASQSLHGPHRTFDDNWPGTTTGNAVFVPDFGTKIRGGDLKLSASATVNGVQLSGQVTGYKILGPSSGSTADTQIRNQLHTVLTNSTLRKIASDESGGHQFDATGYPLWSGDGQGGVGVMQITNPSPTVDQVWSWHENVVNGKKLFKEKVENARGLQGIIRENVTTIVNGYRKRQQRPQIQIIVPALSTHGSNLATFDQEFEGVTFSNTNDQLEQDAIRCFNGVGPKEIDTFGQQTRLHEFRIRRTAANPPVPIFVESDDEIEANLRATVQWEHATPRSSYFPPGQCPATCDYVERVLGADDLPH